MSSKHSSVTRTDLYSGLFNGLETTAEFVVVDLRRHLSAVVLNGPDRAALPGQATQSSLEVVDDAHLTESSSGRPWRLDMGGPGGLAGVPETADCEGGRSQLDGHLVSRYPQ